MAAVGIWRTIFELKDQLPWQSHQITVITLVWIALKQTCVLAGTNANEKYGFSMIWDALCVQTSDDHVKKKAFLDAF